MSPEDLIASESQIGRSAEAVASNRFGTTTKLADGLIKFSRADHRLKKLTQSCGFASDVQRRPTSSRQNNAKRRARWVTLVCGVHVSLRGTYVRQQRSAHFALCATRAHFVVAKKNQQARDFILSSSRLSSSSGRISRRLKRGRPSSLGCGRSISAGTGGLNER